MKKYAGDVLASQILTFTAGLVLCFIVTNQNPESAWFLIPVVACWGFARWLVRRIL